MDDEGPATLGGSYFLTEEGKVERGLRNQQFARTDSPTPCQVCGVSTVVTEYWGGGIEHCPPWWCFSDVIRTAAQGSQRRRFDTTGLGGLENLNCLQAPREVNTGGLGTVLCRARLSEPSQWTTPILKFQNRLGQSLFPCPLF